ncbi:MAG: carbamoyl-phosphate synthase [Thermoactinomyces sp.]
MHHDYPAVVLDLSANGLGIVRSLRRIGIQVYAYDIKDKYRIGKTRYATCGICPHPVYEEKEMLFFLTQLGRSLAKKAVLYAGSDDFVYFISKNREELAPYYFFLLPEHSLVEAVLDKICTYQLACERNVPSPKTFVVHHVDKLESIISELDFPCILKPAYPLEFRKRLNKKAMIIEDAVQLRQEYPFYRQFGELVIQEIIPGNDENMYEVCTFFDEQMNLIGLFTGQKLHQFPPFFGAGALVLSIRDEEVAEAGISFLKALQFKGLAHAEFKRDPRDGTLKFIEINARTTFWNSLSEPCGVDLSYLYYLSLTGQQPEPRTEQKEGMKWVYFVRDYLSFRQKRKNGVMTFAEWVKSLSGKKEYALFAWDDPLPFFRSLFSHLYNDWKNSRKNNDKKGVFSKWLLSKEHSKQKNGLIK